LHSTSEKTAGKCGTPRLRSGGNLGAHHVGQRIREV
jgi:hypothetical protein